jgi:hypothetical protein
VSGVNAMVCCSAPHMPKSSNFIAFLLLVVFSTQISPRDFVSSSKIFFLSGHRSVKSSVANIVVIFTVALIALNIAAVVVGALLGIAIGPRYDSLIKLTAVCVAIEIFMSREKRTLEKWEFHAFAIAGALIGTVFPVMLLLALDPEVLTRPISEALRIGGLFIVVGLSAFMVGIQYFMIYWAARFWAWNHLRTNANAKANRR